ncbi:MAG TPA: hypothetical protein VHZ99_13635 [Steroidobacteraceae bacterium]|nr:hypothetical protein [Steroidobacteraceae bacterium]
MAERKECSAVARESLAASLIVTCKSIDAGQMIGVKPVLDSKQEYQRAQRAPFVRYVVHRSPRSLGWTEGRMLAYKQRRTSRH